MYVCRKLSRATVSGGAFGGSVCFLTSSTFQSCGGAFVETPAYAGPDRRFKSLGPPGGIGRRSTDLSAEIGDASEPNLSQVEIDSFMKPVRMSLE